MTKNNRTIQEKITALDELVAWFDTDDFQLEQASAKLKEASALASDIEQDLKSVENEITIVKQSFATEND